MKLIKKTSIFILVLLFLSVWVCGEEVEHFGADKLPQALPKGSAALMEDLSPTEQVDFIQAALSMFTQAATQSGGKVKSAVVTMLRVLLIVVVCGIVEAMSEDEGKYAASITGVLAIMACCTSGIKAMVGLGKETMHEIATFSKLLLPVMTAASTASGSLTGSGVTYTLAVMFSNVLIQFSNFLLVPAVYASLGLAAADGVLQAERFKRLREMICWLIEKGLKLVIYLFTGLLTISGFLSSSADAAAIKAAKSAIYGMVPVVGGIISGAADTVLAGAALIKNAAGTYGMLAILSIFLLPFISMGISFIMFKFTSAISGIFTTKLSGLLEAISSAMGYLLAMIASCAMIGILSCCWFIRSVQV